MKDTDSECVAGTGEVSNAYKILVEEPEGKYH